MEGENHAKGEEKVEKREMGVRQTCLQMAVENIESTPSGFYIARIAYILLI